MIKNIIEFIKKILSSKGVYFVGSTDKLPEPLSKEEEIKYVELSMNGDEFARNKLIEHNLRLVVFLSKKYEKTCMKIAINILGDKHHVPRTHRQALTEINVSATPLLDKPQPCFAPVAVSSAKMIIAENVF